MEIGKDAAKCQQRVLGTKEKEKRQGIKKNKSRNKEKENGKRKKKENRKTKKVHA